MDLFNKLGEILRPENLIEDEGYSKGEICNRDGCKGILAEHDSDGCCSCHINPPCSYCETSKEYCPECGWDGREEQMEAQNTYEPTPEQIDKWAEERRDSSEKMDLFYQKFNGKIPVDKFETRTSSHTHSSQKVEGIFPSGSMTQEEILPYVKGSWGGRWEHFGDYNFTYIAYTD